MSKQDSADSPQIQELDLETAKKIASTLCAPGALDEQQKLFIEAVRVILREEHGFEFEEEEFDSEEGDKGNNNNQSSTESNPAIEAILQQSATTAAATTAAAASASATTASTVSTAIAQLQSLGTAGVIAMSSAVYFQGGAVYDNAETIVDMTVPMVEELFETGTITPPPESSYYEREVPVTETFLGKQVGAGRPQPEPSEDNEGDDKEKDTKDEGESKGEAVSNEDKKTAEDKKSIGEPKKKESVLKKLFGKDEKKSEQKKEDSKPEAESKPKPESTKNDSVSKSEDGKETEGEQESKESKSLFGYVKQLVQPKPESTPNEPVKPEVDVAAASASVSDEELKEAGISRKGFEQWVADGGPSDRTPYIEMEDTPPEPPPEPMMMDMPEMEQEDFEAFQESVQEAFNIFDSGRLEQDATPI